MSAEIQEDQTEAPQAEPQTGAENLPSGGFRVMVGGTPFILKPSSFANRDEKETLIRSLRPSLAEQLEKADAIPEKYRDRFVDQLFEKHGQQLGVVTFLEESEFDRSATGVAWNFWKSACGDHPEVDSIDAARTVLDKLTRTEAVTLLAALGLV